MHEKQGDQLGVGEERGLFSVAIGGMERRGWYMRNA